MRLYFELSPNEEPVAFDYQHLLIGTFHRWLGRNDLHDGISLYSLSWLTGGRSSGRVLAFPRGAQWFISAHDDKLLHALVEGVLREPAVCCGMQVAGITQQATPAFGGYHGFKTGSPVLARSQEVKGEIRHYLHSDPEADAVLTQTLRHKMDMAGLSAEHKKVQVRFDRAYRNAKTKLVTIKGVHNRASICPVIVEGTPEAVQFAWNVGVGHLTGSGFGSLL